MGQLFLCISPGPNRTLRRGSAPAGRLGIALEGTGTGHGRSSDGMGREAVCTVSVAGATYVARALLETDHVRLAADARRRFAFDAMSAVEADGAELHFDSPDGHVVLVLGEREAARWAQAIVHPKTRVQKLGLRPGARSFACGLDAAFAVEAAAAGVSFEGELRGRFDSIFAGIDTPRELDSVAAYVEHLAPNGALWLVYAKGKGAPISERAVREALLGAGLVDVKVAAFSATHTAIKAVIPVSRRS